MILQSLYKYSERIHPGSLAFNDDRVHWILDIDLKGHLLGLTFTGEKKDKGVGYRHPRFCIPMMTEDWGKSRSGTKVSPQYLLDNFEYLFGLCADRKKAKRATKCSEGFHQKLTEVADRTGSKPLKAFLKCLKETMRNPKIIMDFLETAGGIDIHHRSGRRGTAPKHWNKSQSIMVRIGGKSIFDYPEIRRDWEECYSQALQASEEKVQCMVTGKVGAPTKLHRKIKLIGTQGAGAPLICFNDPSFESFGKKGNDNAPMCAEASERIAMAMEALLRSDSNRYILPSGATVLFFTGDAKYEDFFARILEGDAETVKDFYRAPYTGYQPEPDTHCEDFHSFILRGESGRISIRSVLVKDHRQVLEALRQHYVDLDIGMEYPLKIKGILRSAFKSSDENAFFGGSEEQLYLAAVSGAPYPRGILQGLVSQCCHLPQGHSRQEQSSKYAGFLRVAASYGKAYINRAIRAGTITKYKPLEEILDKSNTSVPYRMGRLLAVLERLRRRAIPNSPLLSEIAMSMFMQRPRLAIDVHYANHVHHIRKLKERGAWYKTIIGEIMGGIQVNGIPTRLSVEDRVSVVLGYEHQKEELFKSNRKEKEETEAE